MLEVACCLAVVLPLVLVLYVRSPRGRRSRLGGWLRGLAARGEIKRLARQWEEEGK